VESAPPPGIGEATARVLAADGHRLALLGRRADRIQALAGELGKTARSGVMLLAPFSSDQKGRDPADGGGQPAGRHDRDRGLPRSAPRRRRRPGQPLVGRRAHRAAGHGGRLEGVSVAGFYDGFAADYHLVYGDRWDDAVAQQGAALDRVIREARPDARDVLDCSCGIGTQAIGLARRGYRVTGTDVSERSLERARVEAERLGATLSLGVADFRDLGPVAGDFDVVLSCDNAVPHLLDDADVGLALRAMRSKVRPGGLLVIGVRDYDQPLVERPPVLVPGPPRRLLVRVHDWDAPDSPFYSVRFFVLEEDGDWTLAHHAGRYRAISTTALTRIAEEAGFADVAWRTGAAAGYHQPVMTATA
jgi:glycine/sarcosine N-methyltransferase